MNVAGYYHTEVSNRPDPKGRPVDVPGYHYTEARNREAGKPLIRRAPRKMHRERRSLRPCGGSQPLTAQPSTASRQPVPSSSVSPVSTRSGWVSSASASPRAGHTAIPITWRIMRADRHREGASIIIPHLGLESNKCHRLHPSHQSITHLIYGGVGLRVASTLRRLITDCLVLDRVRSASAIASGIVPIAIGVDGGGSIRIPAGLSGIWGIKPSYGRIPDVRTTSPGKGLPHGTHARRTPEDADASPKGMACFQIKPGRAHPLLNGGSRIPLSPDEWSYAVQQL